MDLRGAVELDFTMSVGASSCIGHSSKALAESDPPDRQLPAESSKTAWWIQRGYQVLLCNITPTALHDIYTVQTAPLSIWVQLAASNPARCKPAAQHHCSFNHLAPGGSCAL